MVNIFLIANNAIMCKEFIMNIDWQQASLRFVGCVSGVQEFLEKEDKNQIDILAVESLELFLQLPSEILKKKKVLILSEPQSGLTEDVRFVKAEDKDELNDVLKELSEECLKEINYAQFWDESKMHMREKLLRDLLYGSATDSLAERCALLDMNPNAEYYVIGIELDNIEEDFRSLEEGEKELLVGQLSQAISSVLKEQNKSVFLTVSEGKFVLLLPEDEVKNISLTCSRIYKVTSQNIDKSITYGVNERAVSLAYLRDGYTKVCEALYYKYLVGNNRVIYCDKISNHNVSGNYLLDSVSIQGHLVRAVKNGEKEAVESLCAEWFRNLGKYSPDFVKSQLLQLSCNLTIAMLDSDVSLTDLFGEEDALIKKILRFDTIFDVELWMKQILQYICDYVNDKKQRTSYRVAMKAARYIDAHYTENITVEMVAAAVSLSAGYLMGIFKKEFHTSVIGYMTDKRIEKAKELLVENKMKIQEIAEVVGYSNATFFSSTFHKRVGQTPRQYREQYAKENKK